MKKKKVSLRVNVFLIIHLLVCQSEYRQNYNLETTLTQVYNDVKILAMGEDAFLILLDLSAEFDTLDQVMLNKRLKVFC